MHQKADGVDGSRPRHQSAILWKRKSNQEGRDPPAMEITTIGLDLAKNVFQVHAINGSGEVVVRKALRRAQVLRFFERLAPMSRGHRGVRDEPPLGSGDQKAWSRGTSDAPGLYVKRGKTDERTAEATC